MGRAQRLVAAGATLAALVVVQPGGGGSAVGADTPPPIGTVTEHDVDSSPAPPMVASDDSVWAGTFGGKLAHIKTNGATQLIPTTGAPTSVVETDTGEIWYGEIFSPHVGKVVGNSVVEYATSSDTGDLLVDGDHIWFSETGNKIGRVRIADGAIDEYATNGPTRNLIKGMNGNVWFADDSGYLGQVDSSGHVAEYAVDGYSSGLGGRNGLLPAVDGLWFGVFPAHELGFVSYDGDVTYYATDGATGNPIFGPDDDVWFPTDVSIGRIDPVTHEMASYPTTIEPGFLLVGNDGNVWFGTNGTDHAVGRVTPDGVVNEVSTTGAPIFLVNGADGNVWFGELDANFVGRVDLSGNVSEFATTDTTRYLVPSSPPFQPGTGLVWFATNGSETKGVVGSVVAARAQLMLGTTCDGSSVCEVRAGTTFSIEGVVGNDGPSDAGHVLLVGDTFPPGWGGSSTSASASDGAISGDCIIDVVCLAGQMTTGSRVDLTQEVFVPRDASGSYQLTATVAYDGPIPDQELASATLTINVIPDETSTVEPHFTG